MKKYLFVTVLIAVILSSVFAQASLIAYGNVTDPSGDSTNTSPDMVSGSISIDSTGNAIFNVTFAPGTSLTDAAASWNLDTDKNPATGWPGVDTANKADSNCKSTT